MWSSLAPAGKLGKLSGISGPWKTSLRLQSSTRGRTGTRTWTADEDRKLRELRQQGLPTRRIADEIEGHSYDSISQRLRKLGSTIMTAEKFTFWTAEEDALLTEKRREGLSTFEIARFFHGRTFDAVQRRLMCSANNPLGEHGRSQTQKVTDDEIRRMIDMRVYEGKSVAETAIELGRSYESAESIWWRRCRQLLSQEMQDILRNRRGWTPAETQHLLELHRRGTMRRDDAALHFPSKTISAVRCKTLRMRLSFPTESSKEPVALASQKQRQHYVL